MATDHNGLVYRKQGGDELVVASGGKITVESGGVIDGTGIAGTVSVAADVLAIPVTHAHVAKTTGADAEALTLANGTPGQILTVSLVVDGGGDGTLTPATATGFTNVVLADAGDVVSLRFVDATVGWVVLGTAGVAAPPALT